MSYPQPEQTIFLIGAPRSGTTLVLDFLTAHPEFAWIATDLDQKPTRLDLARRVRCFDWPLLGEFWFERRFAWKSLPDPAENSGFWDHWLPGFSPSPENPRPPKAEDVSEEHIQRARSAVAEVCALQRRKRFVGQYSGFPRVDLMRRAFPQACFVQCLRDPRSIAWWMAKRIKKQPDFPLWKNREVWKQAMPEPLRERLSSLPDTPLNYTGVLVRWHHQCLREELAPVPPEQRREVSYSDLLAKPDETLARLFRSLNVEQCPRLKTYLRHHGIRESNRRSRKEMTPEEADQLEQAVAG